MRPVLSALQILWRNPPAMSPGPSFASTPECASPRSPPSASRAGSSTSASGPTLIRLTEVAPRLGNEGRRFLDHLADENVR